MLACLYVYVCVVHIFINYRKYKSMVCQQLCMQDKLIQYY